MQRESSDPNQYWSNLRFLMYTSSFTVGVDYTQHNFHRMFVHADHTTCTARDVKQMMGGIRYLIDKYIGVCGPTAVCESLHPVPLSYIEVKNSLTQL